MQTSEPGDVDAASVALRAERLRLQAARLALEEAGARVQLAVLSRDHALKHRELRELQQPHNISEDSDASAASCSPPAKRPRPASSPLLPDAEGPPPDESAVLLALRADEADATAQVDAAKGRLQDLRQQLGERQQLVREAAHQLAEVRSARAHQVPFLPDAVLLTVLSFLRTRQLLACRQVSRRFRDLCLHPTLWRSRAPTRYGDLCAALRLAPCMRALALLNFKDLAAWAAVTTCVIGDLDLVSVSNDFLAPATTVVRNQVALGGLRKLSVFLRTDETAFLADLLKAVYSLAQLEELVLVSFEPVSALSVRFRLTVAEVARASLKKLTLCGTNLNPFRDLLLKSHAATLEEVYIGKAKDVPVDLIRLLPRLKDLQCRPHEGLDQLLPCPSLKSVSLVHRDGEFPPGAVHFLRGSQSLKAVTMSVPAREPLAPLRALAASESAARLESLNLVDARNATPAILAKALKKFPILEDLTLDCRAPEAFLRAVSPASAPRLRRLYAAASTEGCFHEALHGPAVQDVLARNPELHLFLTGQPLVAADCACPWCAWGCHRELRTICVGARWGFSSHRRRPECGDFYNCVQIAGFV